MAASPSVSEAGGAVDVPHPDVILGANTTKVPRSAKQARWTFDKRADIKTSQSQSRTLAREVTQVRQDGILLMFPESPSIFRRYKNPDG